MKFTTNPNDQLVKFELKLMPETGIVSVFIDNIEAISFDNETGELLHWAFTEKEATYLKDKGFQLTNDRHFKTIFYDDFGSKV